ncbi:MAG TPA: sucrase ferredoxin [Gaiella sp.]|jgi:hypothetical protein|nr:sucrase ferredoxin [Gaiella sp.]
MERSTEARRPFCSAVSSARGEPLAATASRIDHWVLMEHRGPWRRDVLGGSLLSPALKAHLREQLAALPHARLLFVRRPERRAETGRRVVIGQSRPGDEWFVACDVEHLDDLLAVDLLAGPTGGSGPWAPLEEPLFVVCTHGKRDRCCAREGRPLYEALRRAAPRAEVWQSTHVGGDRFAGNVVVLPQGLYFGRVGPEDVEPLLASLGAGEIDLHRYRGRSAYSFPVQAAEQAVRESEGLLGIGDVDVVGSRRLADDRWRVRLRTPDGAVHELDVDATLGDEAVYLTCDSVEPRPARHHRVTGHRVRSPR